MTNVDLELTSIGLVMKDCQEMVEEVSHLVFPINFIHIYPEIQ